MPPEGPLGDIGRASGREATPLPTSISPTGIACRVFAKGDTNEPVGASES